MSEENIGTTPVTDVAESTTEATEAQVNQDAVPVSEAQATIEETKTDGVVEAAEKVARKMKLKVDGVEQELPEDEVIKLAQMSKAAQKRFNEAAKARKEAAQFLDMLKKDPKAVLEHPDIGVDVKKFAEDYLLKELEKQEMSPEAKRAYEAEQKLAQIEKEKEELAQQQEEQKQLQLQEHYKVEYEQSIKEALDTTQIPKTAQSVQRMAIYMSAALENGVDLDPKTAAEMVRQDYMGDLMTMLGQADGETLLGFLGEEVATKIRKTDLARLEAKLNPSQPKAEGEASVEDVQESFPITTKEEAEGRKYMNPIEWREYMEKMRNS